MRRYVMRLFRLSVAKLNFYPVFRFHDNEALEKIARAGGENPPFADGEVRAAALARAIRKTSGATYGI
ncbi:hypothetical protein FIL92_01000, partial [SAR202 cluster bacterium AD-812-D07_MRT_10900m]|nr:hypothetical protein [SAR202 cluster bacterium AD-812-D07_MRT_10900m]